MTARGLLDYLMSEENNVIDLSSLDQYMDMNKPLNHYFVNSSHNTYLNGEVDYLIERILFRGGRGSGLPKIEGG